MYFLYPNFLWALFLLSIPVILHFFNIRRYKKIYFSDIRWIKQITQESQIKNKLKEYLILIFRILALLFLVLAFAQPVFKKKDSILFQKNSQNVLIYIDNSFSMENVMKDGRLIDVSINKAKEIIQSFNKSTKFYIFTNDMDIRLMKPMSQEESKEHLSKIKTSYSSVPLSVIFNRIHTLQLDKPILFILSDAQKYFTDVQNIKNKDIFTYYFLFSATQNNNLSIDSVWIENPVVLKSVPQQLHIKITNHNSENSNEIPVKLILNNTQKSIINVSIPAQQSIEASTILIPDDKPTQFAKIFINDYLVTFDDELCFSINSDIKIKVLLINGQNNPASSKYFKSFFQNDSIFIFSEQSEKQINFSELAQQDVVILNELSEYSSGLEEQLKIICEKGKTILIIPYIQENTVQLPVELQSLNWNIDTSKQTLNDDFLKHPLLVSSFEKTDKNFKMPFIKEYIYLNKNANPNMEPIIKFNNNQSFLIKYIKNKWNYFIFTSTFNPEKNQLPLHAVFVPILYQLSFTSIPLTPLYYYIKSNQNIKIPNINFTSDDSPKIISVDKNNTIQIIPIFKNLNNTSVINIPLHYDIEPGHYFLQWKGKNILALSFNFNRNESKMKFYTENELKNLVNQYQVKNFHINELSSNSIKKIIQTEISGQSYWKLCLFLCLIFFIAESLIIRWMK